MRQHLLKAAAVGGLSLTFSTAAMAYCGSQPSVNCQRPVAAAPCAAPAPQMMAPMAAPQGQTNCQTDFVIQNESDYVTDPVVIHNSQPMGYLRSVKLHNSPHVNIMRVHGQPQTVGLEDAPTGFTQGCHPSSTTYCRQQAPQAAQIQAPAPAPKPYIAPPLKEVKAPVKQHQYGSTELVRGTAYLPTSHVNRNYDDAVAVLNSGPIPARPAVNGGQVPHPSMFDNKLYIDNARQVTFKKVNTTTWYPNHPSLQAHAPAQLGHAQTVQAQAAQWEKVSGPTMIGGLQATQVICRRPATPQQAVEMHPACAQQAPMGYAAPMMMPAPMMPAPMMQMKTTSHSSRYGSDY